MRRSSATVPACVSPPSRTRSARRRAFPALAAICLLLAGVLPLGLSPASNARAQESAVPYGDVIVVLTDPRADAARFARDEDVNPRRVYQHVFRGFAANITQRRAEHLAKHPRVAFISPIVEFQSTIQDLPAGVDRVDADENAVAAIDGIDSEVDADIAILDSGIDAEHEDLNVVENVACTNLGIASESSGHGTHVAGIAAARDNSVGVVGVAPGARISNVRVLDGLSGTSDEIICGLDWVIAHADTIDVVNMSIATSSASGGANSECWEHAMHLAVCNTVAAGVAVVVAAGNGNTSASSYAPAAFEEVITVSNFADFDGESGGLGSRPSGCTGTDDVFSSSSNDGPDVDIAAPGTCVLSTLPNNSYGISTGTSMSAPHVAGAVALYKSVNPGASPAQAKAWLLENGHAQSGPNGFTGDTDDFEEPALSVGQEITQAPTPEPGPPFLESNGQVVMEAEHAQRLISRDEHAWYFRDEDTGMYIAGFAGDGFVRLEPDSGDNWLDVYASAAPELQFDVHFSTPGTYYVWARAQANNNAADSLHAGIDGSAPLSAKYIQLDDNVGWNWTNTHDDVDGSPVATITVPSAGLHTISVWPREDGVRVDRVILTTNAGFTPTGAGPAESPQGEPPPDAFQETDGFVQFEAEDQHAQIDRSNHDWRFENDVIAGYSGVGYLRVRPDSGHNWLSSFASSSPEVQYRVDFETPGTYYVWARLQATDAADDSFHVGVNGVPVPSATNMGTDGVGGGFRWSNRRGGSVGTITITSPGVRTINFWAREDGLRMDQVILTTDGGFEPAAEPEPPADLIEIEAEDFADAIDRDGHEWDIESSLGGYSGAGYVGANPDDGGNWVSGYVTTAPELQYDVDFPAAGTYQIWFLTQADDGGDNSLHAGLLGPPENLVTNVTTGTGSPWRWSSATINVPTSGNQTFSIWAREDGLNLDKIILTTDDAFEPQAVAAAAEATPSPTPEITPEPTVEATVTAEPLPPFAEQQGVVALEAEDFHAETPRADAAWTVQTDVEGFAGDGFVRAEPDNGLAIDAGYAETSPALEYEVEFAGAGAYYLWLRGLATGDGDDTIHIGVDGQEVTTARAVDLVEDGTWQWTNAAADGVATVEIPGPGLHTITVWVAEDGVRLDRLVLTSDAAFVPDGQGPPASPRTDVAAATAADPTVTPDVSPTATPEPLPTTVPTEEVTPEPTAVPTEPPATATSAPEPTATPPPEPTPTEVPVEEEAEEEADAV